MARPAPALPHTATRGNVGVIAHARAVCREVGLNLGDETAKRRARNGQMVMTIEDVSEMLLDKVDALSVCGQLA